MTLWRSLTQDLTHPRRRTRDRSIDPQDVPLRELFSPGFMEANTSFATFGDMLRASAGRRPSQEAWQVAFRDPAWDEHVRTTTKFGSWKAMRTAAAASLRRQRN